VSVSIDDVRHIAALARLGLTDERALAATAELNTILAHMEILSRVDTADVSEAEESGARMPLRADRGPPIALEAPIVSVAPSMRDGFFLVPRLSTHEDPEASA
jgi:aspartyl-tRNA(Asn)/glutamyl-tRNA(Gln) amidotransferase subunit C